MASNRTARLLPDRPIPSRRVTTQLGCYSSGDIPSLRRLVFLFAFDLLELEGRDLRREPFEVRKTTLSSVLRARPGLAYSLTSILSMRTARSCSGTPARWASK